MAINNGNAVRINNQNYIITLNSILHISVQNASLIRFSVFDLLKCFYFTFNISNVHLDFEMNYTFRLNFHTSINLCFLLLKKNKTQNKRTI